jgi:hypothetical protein
MAADLAEFVAGKYSLDRALSDYMHSAFPHTVSQSESTATVDAVPAQGSSGKRAAAARPAEPNPVATAPADSAPTEGERTIIDIIRITAYSGRRFFAIGGATAAVVLLALFAVDVFVTRMTKPARDTYFKFFPPAAKVYTIPSGAEVTVDGKKQERAGRGQAVRLSVGPGTHEVAAYLSGFGWERTQITVLPEKGEVQAETLRFKVPVYVRTKPDGAAVIWDGREFGKAPLDGLPVAVTEQPVPVKFALPGFDTLACDLDLTRAGSYNVNTYIAVNAKPATDGVTALEVDVTFYARWRFIVSPPNARFELDGDDTPLGPNGNMVLLVKYGDHTAKAKKESFSPCPMAFTVTSGETLTKRLTLLRQVTVVAMETDSRSEVNGATVTIEGTTHASRNSFSLSVGSHTAVVKAEGYLEQTKTIRVGEDGASVFEVELPRGERPITICVLRNGVPVSGVTVQAVPEPGSGGSRKSLGETNAAGECRTSTGELLGRYKFDIIMADGGRFSDTTWHEISWKDKSTIAVNIPE